MAGGSIGVNPTSSFIDINVAATDFLWAVFALMLTSDLIFMFLTWRRPVGTRIFHQLPVIILTTAAISYFSMASDLGSTPIATEFSRGAPARATRSIWYVRYIDWTITTPLLLLELLLATGLPLSDVLTVVFMDLVMIITGLVGALVASRYKWGYYSFGCAAFAYIWYKLFVDARRSAGALGVDVRSAFTKSAFFLMVVWLLYPIAWGVADGGNVISPLKEMIFYGILDLVAKPVFCFFHLFALRRIPYERFALQSGKASVGYAAGPGAVAPAVLGAGGKVVPGPGPMLAGNGTAAVPGAVTASGSAGAAGRAGLAQRAGSARNVNVVNEAATAGTGGPAVTAPVLATA